MKIKGIIIITVVLVLLAPLCLSLCAAADESAPEGEASAVYADHTAGYVPKKPASVFSPHFAAAALIIGIDVFAVSIWVVRIVRKKKAIKAEIDAYNAAYGDQLAPAAANPAPSDPGGEA